MTMRRIDAVDLARAIALLGMMLTHLAPPAQGPRPSLADLLAGGRAAPLFALLAGLSLGLVFRRDPRGTGSAQVTAVRAALLLLIGFGLTALDEVPVLVILPYYALLILLVLPVRSWSPTWLFVAAAVWTLVTPVVLIAWTIDGTAPALDGRQPGFSDLDQPLGLLTTLLIWGAYPVLVWVAYLLVGLGVAGLDLRSARVARRLVAAGAALVVLPLSLGLLAIDSGILAPLIGPESVWQLWVHDGGFAVDWKALLVAGSHTSTPLNVAGAIGSALLVIGLCALACRISWLVAVLAPLRAAGSMPLTLYVAHVVLTWLSPAHDWRFTDGGYSEWWAQVALLVVFAWIWHGLVGRGPIEWAVRRISLLARPRA